MNRNQFSSALAIATSADDLSNVDDSILHGCYTKQFPSKVTTTVEVVAKMLRHLCLQLNGSIDSHELDQFRKFTRHRVEVV